MHLKNNSTLLKIALPLVKPISLKSTQRGSSLVIAIFILVVMTLLGTALLNMMAKNEEAYSYEIMGTRAYNAAQSGLQRKLQQIFPLKTATNNGLDATMCSVNQYAFNTITGLENCFADISCEIVNHTIDNQETLYFTVTSVGQCEINGEVTSRAVEVQAKSM